jgi:hypothetical protein
MITMRIKTDYRQVKFSHNGNINVGIISMPAVAKNTTIAGSFGWSCRKSEKIRRNIRFLIKFMQNRAENAE